MNIEQELAAFEAWWEKEGQYCHAGGGDYEKTFAYRAYQSGRAALQSQDREDAERLDWLDMTAHCADWMEDEPTKRVIRAHDGAEFQGDTWREAIDHARRIDKENQ